MFGLELMEIYLILAPISLAIYACCAPFYL